MLPSLSPSAWTVGLFGCAAIVAGLQGLLSPAAAVKGFGVNWIKPSLRPATDLTEFFQGGFALGAIHIGVFYILAALTNWRPFFYATVALRLFTLYITKRKVANGQLEAKFAQVAMADGAGAVVTLIALVFEKLRY